MEEPLRRKVEENLTEKTELHPLVRCQFQGLPDKHRKALTDIQMYAMEDALGVKFNMIRYESGSECSVAVAGKHVDAVLTFAFQLMPLVRAGKIRALAVFSSKADPSLPAVPTIGGLGYRNVPCLPATNGFAAPPHTSEEIVNILQRAIKNMTDDPECGVVAQKLGVDLDFQPPAEVAKMIAQYYGVIDKYKLLIK